MIGTSPAAILFDKDGNPVDIHRAGSAAAVATADPDTVYLLTQILGELRMMRIIMQETSEIEIDEGDV